MIQNGDHDITVSIKRLNEDEFLPYRKIDIGILGSISPLKPTIEESRPSTEDAADPEEFISPRSRSKRRGTFFPKDVIFRNHNSLLDRFAHEAVKKK